jgi:Flp pilus assembly protein TadG
MSRQRPLHHRRNFASATSGAAAVEFAILLPLYLFFLLGMVAYGIYFGAAHSVQQLSADAARTAIAGLSAEERQTLARRFIERNAEGYLFIDPDKLDVVIGDSTADGSQFDVTLSYDATDLPIWGLWERLPMPSRTILRRSTIRMGGI